MFGKNIEDSLRVEVERDIIEKKLREEWFNGHKAIYTEYDDLKVLKWENPEVVSYCIKYIFDGNKLFVSGDLGEAVFNFPETVDINILKDYKLNYFHSKLLAYHDELSEFDRNKALAVLKK